jgi:hypothetical protein
MARETTEQKQWRLILDDAETPPALKDEARRNLGIEAETCQSVVYSADLDSIVESYWNRRKDELEERHPVAERVYQILVSQNILGGNPAEVEEDAEILLTVFDCCRSDWMRHKTARALLSIRCCLDRTAVNPDTLRRIDDALSSIVDFDVTQPQVGHPDWLGLIQRSNTSQQKDEDEDQQQSN